MRRAAFLAVVLSFCAGCGDDTPTSASSTTPVNGTERFDAIINVRESKFFPFSVGSSGTTTINLASLSPIGRQGVVNATMEIGWGKAIKDESGTVVSCDLARVIQTTPALAAQLSDTLAPASDYCANIADVGGLRESANFSMRISHP
jgi:hypothetical protein